MTVSQLLTKIQDSQNKANSLSDAREFHDPDTAKSSGASRVPSQPLIIPSPRGVRSRDSGLPRDTRNTVGTSGNVFEGLLAHLSSETQRIWHHPLEEKEYESRRVRQFLLHVFNQGAATLNPHCHTGGSNSLNGMMDYPRFQISEMHLEKVF